MLKQREERDIGRYLRSLEGSTRKRPYGNSIDVYSVAGSDFAYLERNHQLLRLSLRSDLRLAKLLRERYEEVAPASRLDPRQWNTIVLSGQLSYEEITALIDHSYQLAKELRSREV